MVTAVITAGESADRLVPSCSVDKYRTEIVDICERGASVTRSDSAAKKPVESLFSQESGWIEAEAAARGWYSHPRRPGGITGAAAAAVGAVGICRNGGDARRAREFGGQRQRIFLLGPPRRCPGSSPSVPRRKE